MSNNMQQLQTAEQVNGDNREEEDEQQLQEQNSSMEFDAKLMAIARYQTLPEPVKRRIRALKKLQFETLQRESEFYKELHELECRYQAKYLPQAERRSAIVNGEVEPTDEDADWPEESEIDAGLSELLKDKMKMVAEEEEKEKEGGEGKEKEAEAAQEQTGVPEFWLTAIKNVDLLSQLVRSHDEPILRCLRDVTVELFNGEGDVDCGFCLNFHFDDTASAYFSNKSLSKRYFMRMTPDRKQPWNYEGPEIVKCEGCDIYWHKGKNVTVKTVKKVQKHKSGGQKRTVTKTVQTESFFNFFSPTITSVEELEEAEDADEAETQLQSDFEIGHFLRERFVPRAVLYYTGEGLEDDDDYEDEEEEDEDEDGDEDEDTDEEGGAGGNAAQKPECKQQ